MFGLTHYFGKICFSYQGKVNDTLPKLRHARYIEMVSSATTVDPAKLPPTERAAYFHAHRVHLQVAQWMTLNLKCLEPTEWGWVGTNGILFPIKTDQIVAPENLLKIIRCKCKLESRNTCGSNLCSCVRNGLKRVLACGNCRGEECNNVDNAIGLDPEDYMVDDTDDDNRNIFDILKDF